MQTEKVCKNNLEMYSKSTLGILYLLIALPLNAPPRNQVESILF
jgi:hypothetical protein